MSGVSGDGEGERNCEDKRRRIKEEKEGERAEERGGDSKESKSRVRKNPAKTRTLEGEEWKDSDVVECVGCLEEANAFIGLARVFSPSDRVRDLLLDVQKFMFRIGCEVSSGKKVVGWGDVEKLESIISSLEESVEIPHSFLILETSKETAFLNVARTVVRRAERRAVSLYRRERVGEELVQWLNRLNYMIYLLILLESEERMEV